jgi:hypothetical protein
MFFFVFMLWDGGRFFDYSSWTSLGRPQRDLQPTTVSNAKLLKYTVVVAALIVPLLYVYIKCKMMVKCWLGTCECLKSRQ